MKTEKVAIDKIIEDPSNARRHPIKNIETIKGSLARFGQQKPIVIDENNVVVAGNGTLEAARAIGWLEIAVVRSKLKGSDRTAYAIADNRTTDLGEWDTAILGEHLETLKMDGFDLAHIGFDGVDMETLFDDNGSGGTEGNTDPDDVPEKPPVICKTGELWQLGEHRLLCGDCTDAANVERLMGGEKADMVFTDPPYGVNERTMRKSAGRGKLAENHDFRPVYGDADNSMALSAFELYGATNGIWWGANHYASGMPDVPSWIIWDKRRGVPSDDNADCEIAWCSNKKPARIFSHLWKGCIRDSEKSESKVHPTQKPIALAEWCFENYGNPNTVLDIFLGSGSTLIACEKTGRRCYGMELDPHYCDVIIKRWEDFTGKKAKKSDGLF